jgi:excisionase family DNA binding protein
MRRRIQIWAVERTRISRGVPTGSCPICLSGEDLLTSIQAAALMQVGQPSIRRWLAQGRAHGFKTPGGQLRICRKSLLREAGPAETGPLE